MHNVLSPLSYRTCQLPFSSSRDQQQVKPPKNQVTAVNKWAPLSTALVPYSLFTLHRRPAPDLRLQKRIRESKPPLHTLRYSHRSATSSSSQYSASEEAGSELYLCYTKPRYLQTRAANIRPRCKL